MRTVLVISSETLGRGSDELGARLMVNFLRRIWASPERPAAVLFYNSGVKLLAHGAPALDAIDGLAVAGVDLVACGTCVTYYGIGDRLHAGRVSDMQEIVATVMSAAKVVSV